MNVTIEPQQRKSLSMHVVRGGVKVRIPCGLDPDDTTVQEFIARALSKLDQRSVSKAAQHSREDIRHRVSFWANKLGLEVKRVQIREMKSKWGSLSSNRTLTLAEDTRQLPIPLLDYLIVHELAHLKFPNHGKGFKLLMDMTLFDWREKERDLAAWMCSKAREHDKWWYSTR